VSSVANVEYTSRERLAASIEILLRQEIPQRTRGDDLSASIDDALQNESCRNERAVAYLRLAATGAMAISLLLIGGVDGLADPGARSIYLVLWTVGAVIVAVALRRGWYRPWIRRALPSADAVAIAVACTALVPWPEPTGGWNAGVAAASGLGALLAVSGALRLTRTSVYYATALGVIAVAGACAMLRLPVTVAVLAAIPVLLAGALGISITQLARRLIITEVGQSAMRRLYGEAKEVIDAREEVLRIVAHDLRNPLNTVAMTTTLLLDVPSTEEQRRQRLTVIQRAGQRMNRLINDLLSVSIIEAGRLTVEPRPTPVSAILDDAMEMLRPIAADKSIRLEISAPASLPDVMADSTRILQVLSNLAGNAIKFTPTGGLVTISASREGSKVRFDVADTGPGIAPEQLTNIFGRFWQANRADARGIGLGLSIAKGIVEAHGEQLRVASTLGLGSTFSFALSVTPGAEHVSSS
jgi:signal transduction histidine kinase